MSDMRGAIEAEIVAFHDFFVDWITGRADTGALETEMAARLDPGFIIVPPSGEVMARAALLSAFGALRGTNPDFRIKVQDVVLRHHLGGHVVASYTEWQRGGAVETGRQSMAIMSDTAPFIWLTVQETWLPDSVVRAGEFDF